jgi:hypothetical protein
MKREKKLGRVVDVRVRLRGRPAEFLAMASEELGSSMSDLLRSAWSEQIDRLKDRFGLALREESESGGDGGEESG